MEISEFHVVNFHNQFPKTLEMMVLHCYSHFTFFLKTNDLEGHN